MGHAAIEALLGGADASARVAAILREKSLERPAPGASDDDPRTWLYWLLQMAGQTARANEAPIDAEQVSRLRELLRERPGQDEGHAQLHIDAESSLRRGLAVQRALSAGPGPVLAVGDDDAVTLALALLGVSDLWVVDIDVRVLRYLKESARSIGARVEILQVDLLEDLAPIELRDRFAVAFTDPVRSFEPCCAFLEFAAACVRPGGTVLWADHPDWNFEHAQVLEALPSLGLALRGVQENLHSYPLTAGWLPDPVEHGRKLAVDPEWLAGLARHTRAWSHLYALQKV